MSQDGAVEDRGPMAGSNGTHQPYWPNAVSPHWAASLGSVSHKGASTMLLAMKWKNKSTSKIFVVVVTVGRSL